MSPAHVVTIGLMGFALMASALANRVLLEAAPPLPARTAVAEPARAVLALVERGRGLCLVRGE